MKKNIYLLVITIFIAGSFTQSFGQTFECRVSENDYGYLVYEMRETSGINTPTTSTDINDITFVLRYPSGAVDMDLICSTNDYNIFDGLAGEQTSGGYDYHYWNASAVPAINPPHDWTVNQWEEIAVFKVIGATGSGTFEVAPDGWDGTSLNWNQTVGGTATDFTPTIFGSGITYSYPTLVYDLVWTGTTNSDWDDSGNWEDACGGGGSIPASGNNCFIPAGLTNYPSTYSLTLTHGQPVCDYLRIQSSASFTLDDIDLLSTQLTYTVNNDLLNYGTVTIIPNSQLTVSGSTYIDGAAGLIVQADTTGVGSLLDNGTISYGTSGTAKVQTYLYNAAGSGSFYIHLVGPTVDEENYTGTGTGAFLQAFDVSPGNTYAYGWDESIDTNGGVRPWVNLTSYTYEVHTADGIALSTTDATTYTLNMTGALMTGPVSSPALTYTTPNGNHLELISNPYPSAVDFDALATANNTVINNKNWLWDPSTGSYLARAGGAGGQQYIQVGQAFLVQTFAAGTFDFTNTERVHSNEPFRSDLPNMLTVKASGGDYNFSDEIIIRFDEGATNGYDEAIEARKLESMYDDATSIRSIASDATELSINVLPYESLSRDLVSVPVKFKCGYDDEYTLDFSGLETFDNGTEVWLEDLKEGGDWVSINENPEYTFTASPDDDQNRFIIHFFGVTGVDQNVALDPVQIYGYGQYVYVVNIGDEPIENVFIYNMSGSQVVSTQVPDQKVNKIWVDNKLAYYIVRVVTDERVYTKKVLISYY